MATRTPQRGPGGEAADTSRKERRHGKSELSPKLKGALKGAGKMAAEEILMTMVPVARIPRLMKLIAKLGPGVKRSEVASALKKEGFDKLASTAPSASELKRMGKNAEARAKVAKKTKEAKRELKLAKEDRRSWQDLKGDQREGRTDTRLSKAKRHESRKLQSTARKRATEGKMSDAKFYNVMSKSAADTADALAKGQQFTRMSREAKAKYKSEMKERKGKQVVQARKKAKAAEATERKVNKLADLSDTIAKNAAKRKKAVRKAAEAKVTRLDSPPFDIKGLKGYSGYTMGAGAKKLDAIPGLEYIDPRDSFPLARDTLAFLKSHKGTADYRLVKQDGKTKAMAVEVEGIHTGGPKTGRKIVHIFDIGEKNAKWFLGY